MQKKSKLIIVLMGLATLWSCDVTETDNTVSIEEAIMADINADENIFDLEGLDNIDEDEYFLERANSGDIDGIGPMSVLMGDSNYVWRFSRREMHNDREFTIEVENDSSTTTLITDHITGQFHVRQFDRIWTSDSTWERGDSVRFSQKPIDQIINRRVIHRLITTPDGEERWRRVAKTIAYGSSGDALSIEALEWIAGDSLRILTDFGDVYYGHDNQLTFPRGPGNSINVIVANELEGDSESVTGRFGGRQGGHGGHDHDFHRRTRFHYEGTRDNGDKEYTGLMPGNDSPQRHFKGHIEVTDDRTLFDHDYEFYTSARVDFSYKLRHHPRP